MSGPILVVNPRADQDFADFARSLVAERDYAARDLERELRARYPKARVRERALSGEQILTWYVYRDGAWVSEELHEMGEDIKATAGDIATDAQRVQAIETEKVGLDADDERLIDLANESESLTAEMAVKAKSETALVQEAADEARDTSDIEHQASP